MNIKFAIPGLWDHFDLTKAFIEYIEQCPEQIYNNVSIGAVYGNFPYCIWDGGRIFLKINHASLEEIIEVKNYLLSKNIPLRLIFTNPIIEEIHYCDRFCNLVADICEDNHNEIVINNAGLESYLREHYPAYGYISSTTKCNNFKDSFQEINKYKYICLDYNQNHNKELFNLTQEQKDHVEFLCNAICPPGCPNRKEHYKLNGVSALNLYRNYNIDCRINGSTVSYNCLSSKNNLSIEEITKYAKQGFSMFKLEGRSLSHLEIILNYANYFIKPEYKLDFIYNFGDFI